MSREQVQIPVGGTGEESEKDRETKPKGLNRPVMPLGLEKPKTLAKKFLRRQCSGCSDPGCMVPANVSGCVWIYYDERGRVVDDPSLPKNGP